MGSCVLKLKARSGLLLDFVWIALTTISFIGVATLEEAGLSGTISSPTPYEEESDCRLEICYHPSVRQDRLGFEAILNLHAQLDDDRNGKVDIEESDEFLRDELAYEDGNERHRKLHGNDRYISAEELWFRWKSSEVHNWTVDEVIDWVVNFVELPQYENIFRDHSLNGSMLPRTMNLSYLSNMGVKESIHKQKIMLKAMDVILFGPQKNHSYFKDVAVVTSLLIALGGCWFAYSQRKYSKQHIKKMVEELEALQHAEQQLLEMQEKLAKVQREQQNMAVEKMCLEARLKDDLHESKNDLTSLQNKDDLGQEITRLKLAEEELIFVRSALRKAEQELESKCWNTCPSDLQRWLQLTYELELKHYEAKKMAAEKQLQAAKEGCEKLRKKRSTFMGTFRIAHGDSIDEVDQRIITARVALHEVTEDFKERLHRWGQIEMLCKCPIVSNPGLAFLEATLYSDESPSSFASVARLVSVGQTTARRHTRTTSLASSLDEDDYSTFSTAGVYGVPHLKDGLHKRVITPPSLARDSSDASLPSLSHSTGSEGIGSTSGNCTPSEGARFVLGDFEGLPERVGPLCTENGKKVISIPIASSSTPSSVQKFTKSISHDSSSPPKEIADFASQKSHSESALSTNHSFQAYNVLKKKKGSTPLFKTSISTCSTIVDEESSSTESQGDEIKKEKKKKKILPNFLKKEKDSSKIQSSS